MGSFQNYLERKHHETGEKWIAKAIGKKGALHKQLGVPQDEKIPVGTLKDAAKKPGKLGKRARLALTLRGLKHETCCHERHQMLHNNLNDIGEYAKKLESLITPDSHVEEWMEHKISVARTYMSDVTHAYINHLKNAHDIDTNEFM